MRGGTLDIGAENRPGEAVEIVVRAAGPKIAFDEVIGNTLEGRMPEGGLTSRTAAARMVALVAKQAGGALQFHRGEGTLVLGAVLPRA